LRRLRAHVCGRGHVYEGHAAVLGEAGAVRGVVPAPGLPTFDRISKCKPVRPFYPSSPCMLLVVRCSWIAACHCHPPSVPAFSQVLGRHEAVDVLQTDNTSCLAKNSTESVRQYSQDASRRLDACRNPSEFWERLVGRPLVRGLDSAHAALASLARPPCAMGRSELDSSDTHARLDDGDANPDTAICRSLEDRQLGCTEDAWF
jgi:hypothetical protein